VAREAGDLFTFLCSHCARACAASGNLDDDWTIIAPSLSSTRSITVIYTLFPASSLRRGEARRALVRARGHAWARARATRRP
jgi:hypothetical protein